MVIYIYILFFLDKVTLALWWDDDLFWELQLEYSVVFSSQTVRKLKKYYETFMKRETNQMHINRALLNIVRENMDFSSQESKSTNTSVVQSQSVSPKCSLF